MNLWSVRRLLVETIRTAVEKLTRFGVALNSRWIAITAAWRTFGGLTCQYHQ